MSTTNEKLMMCWEKSYFKRFDFLPAIPPGNSRGEVLSQKYNNSEKWVQTHLNLAWFVNYIKEERQLCFAFFSLWCLFVVLVPKVGGVGGWCSAGKRLKLTICHFEHWALKGQNLSSHVILQTNLCSFISYFPFPLALQ